MKNFIVFFQLFPLLLLFVEKCSKENILVIRIFISGNPTKVQKERFEKWKKRKKWIPIFLVEGVILFVIAIILAQIVSNTLTKDVILFSGIIFLFVGVMIDSFVGLVRVIPEKDLDFQNE